MLYERFREGVYQIWDPSVGHETSSEGFQMISRHQLKCKK